MVTDIFSVVRPVSPGFGCLWCNQLINPTKLQEEALTVEQLGQQRYVHAPSVISLNAVAAAHAVDDYLLSATGLLPATYEPRWRRFHPASPEIKGRVRYDIPRSDPDCIECSGGGRFGHGHQLRLPTKG